MEADGETVLAGLNEGEVSLSAGLGRSYPGGISWGLVTGDQYLASQDGIDALVDASGGDTYFWKTSFGLSWDKIRYTGLFTQGPSIRMEGEYLEDTAGPDSQITLSGRASWNFLLPRDVLLRFAVTGAYSPDLLPLTTLETRCIYLKSGKKISI